ncbi:antitoxin protein parD-1 [Vibrio cholerae HC-41A1]|nr:antitoxin protein parD-1 [Vibrio cholerae CP1042(15)]EKG45803.1 antitoxin protein parD-1 [Vibrio cholerae HC-41A1]
MVFMEMSSWLKIQVSLLVNTSMALLQAKYKVGVTAQQVKSFALRYVYSKTKKPNYSHSVNYLLKESKVVTLIMTLIASSMNSIVKTFDETI